MQGKTYRDIKAIVNKIQRKYPAQFSINSITSNVEIMTQSQMIGTLAKLEKDRKVFGEASVRIPEVKWDDVGGLASAKEDITQTIMLPIEKPHLFKNGLT